MLLPIDLIIVVIYWTFTSLHRPESAGREFADVLLDTALLAFACILAVEIFTRLARWRLLRRGIAGGPLRDATGAISMGTRGFLVCAYLVQVRLLGWPGDLPRRLGIAQSEFFGALAGLAPYVLMLAVSWLCQYRLDSMLAPDRWSRRRYMLYRMRYSLFILAPWLMLNGIYDLILWLVPQPWLTEIAANPFLARILPYAGLLFVVICFPALLVRMWDCRPLPDGPLRQRLNELQQRAGAKFNRILVWRLGGSSLLNAAVIGFVPPFRYLLLSEGLLQNLTVEETAGVAAHEIGHARRRHLFFYLLFVLAFLSLLVGAVSFFPFADQEILVLVVCIAVAAYMRFMFGFVSRRFEREADLFSLDLIGRSEPLTASLEKIAYLGGNVRNARSWHHSSVAERVAFLKAAEHEPQLARNHYAACERLRRAGGTGAVLLLVLSFAGYLEAAPPPRPRISEPPTQTERLEHWLRVYALLPGNRDAPAKIAELFLANHAPGQAEDLKLAKHYARIALDRAATARQRRRAHELLEDARRRTEPAQNNFGEISE